MTAPTNALLSGDGLAIVEAGEQYRAAFRVSISTVSRTDPPEAFRR